MRLIKAVTSAAGLALVLNGCAFISRASVSNSGDPADFGTPTFSPATISADGRYLAFDSFAGNLVAGAPDGGVFVRDARDNLTTAASLRRDGTVDDVAEAPALSGDGRFVAFATDDGNIVQDGNDSYYQVYLRDRVTGVTTRISSKVNGNQGTEDSNHPSVSGDGRYVAFESDSPGLVTGDTNDWTDVFVRDRVTNTTKRLSLTSTGAEADLGGESPSISADGRKIAFSSSDALVPQDTNETSDIYVRDVVLNTITLVSLATGGTQTNDWSDTPAVSANGRFVAFMSSATNLDGIADTNESPDVFVRDLAAGTTQRVSLSSTGGLAHGAAAWPTISNDGHFVSYESTAPDAVTGDTNGVPDGFVYDRVLATTSRVTTDQLGQELPQGGTGPVLSADGRSVAFASAGQIAGTPATSEVQLYVRLVVPGTTPR